MNEVISLINGMSPFLLLGFLLAGVMHAFIPNTVYGRYLGGRSFRSVVNAALFGVPLPLCSCGVIPTAMSLRKEGASKGATVSFLISTPQTGVDSMIATYSLMGLPFAVIRPIAAFLTALAGGVAVNVTDGDEAGEESQAVVAKASGGKRSFGQKSIEALHYAFVDMMQDIGKWLVVGLIVAGLITVFVPEEFFALFVDNSLLSMLVVLVVAVPMYVCATGSIPIAVALMLKGLSPGAALVLLMAGPAVNAASILVVDKVLGRRSLVAYLLSIIGGAVAFGLAVDCLLPREWFAEPLSRIAMCHADGVSWLNVACSVLLVALLANALIRRYIHRDAPHCHCEPTVTSREITVMVGGMSCNHCRKNVEKAIAALDGVETVTVDLATGKAVIVGTVSRETVSKAVESIGFSVKNEKETK